MRASPESKRSALSILKRECLECETAIANALAGDVTKSQAITKLLSHTTDDDADPKVRAHAKGALDVYARQSMPHVRHKDLLDPALGGSMEKACMHYRSFENHAEALVRALAAERLFVLQHISKQFLPLNKRQSSPRVLPNEALLVARHILRRLSRDIKDATLGFNASSALFADHYGSFMVSSCVDIMSSRPPNDRSSGKRPSSNDHQPSAKKPKNAVSFPDAPSSSAEALRLLSKGNQNTPLGFCKNCYVSLYGKQPHKLTECPQPCALPCPKPKRGRKVHWKKDCPNAHQHGGSSSSKDANA